jgi:hypothetical protein
MSEPRKRATSRRGGASNLGVPSYSLQRDDGKTVYLRPEFIGQPLWTHNGLVYPGAVVVKPGRIGIWYGWANDTCEKLLKKLEIVESARPADDVIESLAEDPLKTMHDAAVAARLLVKLGHAIVLAIVVGVYAIGKNLATKGRWS